MLASLSPNVITEPRHEEYSMRSRIFEFWGQIYIKTKKKKMNANIIYDQIIKNFINNYYWI